MISLESSALPLFFHKKFMSIVDAFLPQSQTITAVLPVQLTRQYTFISIQQPREMLTKVGQTLRSRSWGQKILYN